MRLVSGICALFCLLALSAGAAVAATGDEDPDWHGGDRLRIFAPVFPPATSEHSWALDLIVDGSGRPLIIGGSDQRNNNNQRVDIYQYIARLSPAGAVDTSYGTNGFVVVHNYAGQSVSAQDIAFDPQKRVHVAYLGGDGGVGARYTSNGDLDSGYGTGGVTYVQPQANGIWSSKAVTVGPDGSTYVVVYNLQQTQAGITPLQLLRIDPNGNPDSTYEANGQAAIPEDAFSGQVPYPIIARVDSQGRLYLGRTRKFSTPSGGTALRGDIRRFTPTGALDTTWGTNGVFLGSDLSPTDDGVLRDINITTGDKVLISVAGNNDYIARLTTSGTLDPTFGKQSVTPDPSELKLTTGDDGKVYTAGLLTAGGMMFRRYTSTGQLDPTFSDDGVFIDSDGGDFPQGITTTSNGKLYLVGGSSPGYVARYLTKDATQVPDIVTSPRVTGTPSPGQTLHCQAGSWTRSPTTVDVFWDRAPRSTTSDDDPAWTQLPTMGRDYAVTDADVGSRIRCRERATNSNGTGPDAPSNSLRVDTGTPVSQSAPSVSGIPVKGEVLRCEPGEWTNGPDLTATWLRDGAAIAGVDTLTYRLAEEDRRHHISCEVNAKNDVGSGGPVRATNDVLAVGAPPASLHSPTIDLARVGPKATDVRLTCGDGEWDEDYGQYDYRWEREGAEIAGATGKTYDATVDDLGENVRCYSFSTNPAGRSAASPRSFEVLVPLPATGEPGAIYTGGAYNRLDPLNLFAVTKGWLDKTKELTAARRVAAVDATRKDCAAGQYKNEPLPNFGSVVKPTGVYLSASHTCGVLLRAPAAQIAYAGTTGVYWAGGACRVPNDGGGAGSPCPTLRIDVPRLNASSPPDSVTALEQQQLASIKPLRVLWDFNRDGKTDASCDADSPILRTLPSQGTYNIRAVVISADSQETGLYSVTDLKYSYFPRYDAQVGALRPAQPFACKTTLIPPEEPTQPCISEVSVGRTHMTGNICPVSARRVPEGDLDGLPSNVKTMLESQALNAALKPATGPKTVLKTDVVSFPGFKAEPGSLPYTTTRQIDALSSIGSAAPATIPKQWTDSLKKDLPSFDADQGQHAMDQIYLVRGQAKINGIDVDPQNGSTTVLIPSDAGEALSSIKKMTISSRKAQLSLGGVPIGGVDPLSTDFSDKIGGAAPTLRAANLDDLRAELLKKLDLGPFKLAGDANLRMADDGSAFIDAMAELKGPFKAGSLPIRTKVTIHATREGKLSLAGIHLDVRHALMGAVSVSDMALDYDGNGLSIQGKLLFPPVNQGIAINKFRVDSKGEFRELDISYLAGAGQGINIGPGIYLVKLGGGLSLDPDEIRGRAGVSFGPSPGGGCPTAGVDANLNVHFGRPPPFFVDATSTVELACIPVGNAHFYADATGLLDITADAHFDMGPIYASAGLHGRLKLPDWQIDLHGKGGVRHVFSGEVKAIISNFGLAGCGRVEVFPETPINDAVYVAGGAGIRFSNGRPPFTYAELISNLDLFTGCSLRKWSPFGRDVARVAQADGSRKFTLGKDAPKVVALQVIGAGGAPRVQVVNPKGETLDASQFTEDFTRTPNISGMLDPAHSQTLVFVRGAPGTWTVKPVAGSPPISDIKHSEVVPDPKISAKVGGIGASRILSYKVAKISGQTVRFVEQSKKGMRVIKTVKGGGNGKANFITSEGSGTARTILAEVTQDDMRRETLTVAHFKAPAPKPVRPRVTARRRGAAVTLRWARDPFAATYELVVTTGRGRRFVIAPKKGAHTARITGLAKGEGASVRVTGISPAGYRGPVRVVRVKGSLKLASGAGTDRWDRSRGHGGKKK